MDDDVDVFMDFDDSFDVEFAVNRSPGEENRPPTSKATSDGLDELLRRYEKLQETARNVDECAEQLKNALMVCKQMEDCFSDRIDVEKPRRSLVSNFEVRWLDDDSVFVVLDVENASDRNLDGWSLCIRWSAVSDGEESRESITQTVQIGDLPSSVSKKFEVLIACRNYSSPLLFFITLLREFEAGATRKVLRIPLDVQVVGLWQRLSVKSVRQQQLVKKRVDASAKFSAVGSFDVRLPTTLVDLLCGKPDVVATGNMLKAVLPRSCTQLIGDSTSDVDCVLLEGPKAFDVRLTVAKTPSSYTLTVATKNAGLRERLSTHLEVQLALRMSQLKLRPKKSVDVLPDFSSWHQLFASLLASF